MTALSTLNIATYNSEINLSSYSEAGKVLNFDDRILLNQGAKHINSVTDTFGAKIAHTTSRIKIEYTGQINCFGLMDNDYHLLCQVTA